MSHNLLFKLSWAPEISVRCLGYVKTMCVCTSKLLGGWGVGLLPLRTHKSLNPKIGDISSRRIPLFPSLSIYFLWVEESVSRNAVVSIATLNCSGATCVESVCNNSRALLLKALKLLDTLQALADP
jgi:hypothetical protein